MIRTLGAVAVGCAMAIGGSASAETVSILSVTGTWLTSGPTDVYGLNGLGTNKVSWGRAATRKGQSAFMFDGLSSSTSNIFAANELFSLGTFTHLNQTIYGKGAKTKNLPAFIETARLGITISADFGDGVIRTRDTVFDFTLVETLNNAKICANRQKNRVGVNKFGCADRITLSRNADLSDKFTVDGKQYEFDISGGFSGADEYWTLEKRTNSAQLLASFKFVGLVPPPPPPPPSPVPLPAGGVLLMTALGATAFAKRRRKA